MKGGELLSLWKSPDNTKLTPKQISIRFPLHVAAKVSALCDMFPNKTRTEIIGDLMTSALEDLERSFEFVPGQVIAEDPETGEPIHEDIGQWATFKRLTEKHLGDLEAKINDPKARG